MNNDASFEGRVDISNRLDVDGDTSLNSNVTISGNLDVLSRASLDYLYISNGVDILGDFVEVIN